MRGTGERERERERERGRERGVSQTGGHVVHRGGGRPCEVFQSMKIRNQCLQRNESQVQFFETVEIQIFGMYSKSSVLLYTALH